MIRMQKKTDRPKLAKSFSWSHVLTERDLRNEWQTYKDGEASCLFFRSQFVQIRRRWFESKAPNSCYFYANSSHFKKKYHSTILEFERIEKKRKIMMIILFLFSHSISLSVSLENLWNKALKATFPWAEKILLGALKRGYFPSRVFKNVFFSFLKIHLKEEKKCFSASLQSAENGIEISQPISMHAKS